MACLRLRLIAASPLAAWLIAAVFSALPADAQQPQETLPPAPGPTAGPGGPVLEQPGAGFVAVDDLMIGTNLLVVVSPKRDRIWANSTKYGSWNRQNLPNGALPPIMPLMSENIVCFQAGKYVYAFSAHTGSWNSTQIDEAAPVLLQLSTDVLWFRQGSKIYTYCAKPGNWAKIDVERD